jgi:quercetin dioxygenase-like cupin family protein
MSFTHGRTPAAVVIAGAAVAAFGLASASATSGQPAPASQSRIALSRTLPPMDGREIRVKVVDVTYPPGGANGSHSHPCPVVGYVLEGALRMRVNDGPEAVYRAGDTFYEGPGDVHRTSANASATEPARFLAYFTCDREVTQLSVPAPAPKGAGERR